MNMPIYYYTEPIEIDGQIEAILKKWWKPLMDCSADLVLTESDMQYFKGYADGLAAEERTADVPLAIRLIRELIETVMNAGNIIIHSDENKNQIPKGK